METSASPVLRLDLKRADLGELISDDALLRSCGLIRSLGDQGLKTVLAVAVGRRFRDGVAIFTRLDPGDSLLLVMKGEARLIGREGGESVEPGGARKGDVFGEGGVLEGLKVRETTAVAVGELDVMEVPRQTARTLADALPELVAYLSEIRARRKSASAEMADFLNRW